MTGLPDELPLVVRLLLPLPLLLVVLLPLLEVFGVVVSWLSRVWAICRLRAATTKFMASATQYSFLVNCESRSGLAAAGPYRLGGGVLMIGGVSTFDNSWQSSRLEQLLPVVFAAQSGVLGLDRPFRLELTDEALQEQQRLIAAQQTLRQRLAQLAGTD